MTEQLFLQDAYLSEATATVIAHTQEGGVVLDRSIFYATGGGQPGDTGQLTAEGQPPLTIINTVKGEAGAIVLLAEPDQPLPPVGTEVVQTLDWDRRFGHMRIHTALHLLSVVLPLPVSGGAIGAEKGRLDFNMPEAPEDKAALEQALNDLIAQDLEVTDRWITDAELDAQPDLVKTMSVSPPRGSGKVRLVRIGDETAQIDLQPCGGTHVRKTGEIGAIRLGKVEKKGKQNRRVYVHLAG
ncbi:alanyl-tRNA editing protein [Phaeobacter sp.]|uniref:alanyl-tRNA editing protein n=1 Tax=Phaeobacter sp. TaxID=1902409 RepID=UPI0026006BE5|nr:alanyl-tRNA editing protein [Phaeobacter sp.]